MSDLRKAAEELIEAWDWDCSEPRNIVLRDLIEDLRQALAQPEEKMRIEGNGKLTTKPYPDGYESEQEFREAVRKTSAQPEQEPVAWMNNDYEVFFDAGKAACYSMGWVKPLYTAPPKREWLRLTQDDKNELFNNWWNKNQSFNKLIEDTEAKLKEKNT